jgi:anti-sigma B factor antagonist
MGKNEDADSVGDGVSPAPRPASVESRRDGSVGVVILSGELDLDGGDEVEAAVAGLLAEGVTTVAVDAGQVTFMDSSGLGGVLAARGRVVESGGDFRFGGATDNVARVIDMAGVRDVLCPVDV